MYLPILKRPCAHVFHLIGWLAIINLCCSCISLEPKGPLLKTPTLENSNAEYWLSQSLYGGKFYDHDQLRLIDPRPFSEIKEVETLDGFLLLPPAEDEIIPLGTKVRLKKIQPTTPLERLKRPIYSPKYSTWVYLSIASERGNVNIYRDKLYVMLIPESYSTTDDINGFLNTYFSKTDPNPWFLHQRPFIQDAILDKRPAIGMDKKQMKAALGAPISTLQADQNSTSNPGGGKIYNYSRYVVLMENGRITKVTKKPNG